MKQKKTRMISFHDMLIRHPFRVRIGRTRHDIGSSELGSERTMYVTSVEVATSGLPIGWGILEAHRYEPESGEFVKIA